MTVKELVKDTQARFVCYRDGDLWYELVGKSFQFPVPIVDVGNGIFNMEHKAITLMRWVRKQLDTGIVIK